MFAPGDDDRGEGLSEALRSAVERTFAATAGSASETRERAGELLDEVTRRATDARDAVDDTRRAVVRRGRNAAGGAPGAVAGWIRSSLRGGRSAGDRELEALRGEVARLRRRLAELERGGRARSRHERAKPKPRPED